MEDAVTSAARDKSSPVAKAKSNIDCSIFLIAVGSKPLRPNTS